MIENHALRRRLQRLARDLDRTDAITACRAVAYLAQLLELDPDALADMVAASYAR